MANKIKNYKKKNYKKSYRYKRYSKKIVKVPRPLTIKDEDFTIMEWGYSTKFTVATATVNNSRYRLNSVYDPDYAVGG